MPRWNGRLVVSWRRKLDPPLPPLPPGFSDQSQSSCAPPLQASLVPPFLFSSSRSRYLVGHTFLRVSLIIDEPAEVNQSEVQAEERLTRMIRVGVTTWQRLSQLFKPGM